MRFIVQRVNHASVTVDQTIIGKIQKGFLVFIGITHEDTKEVADKMIKKLLGLRIFEDEDGKTNLDLESVSGELLLISQFTLYADCKKGNRPSFGKAGNPQLAEELYHYIIQNCRLRVAKVEEGSFGADMEVALENNGPFTILLDSQELF